MAAPPEAAVAALLDALADPEAPTTVHDRAQARDVHVADALSGLVVPELAAAGVIADLGSGAGLPGLVLAAALPAARVFLVETVRRKAEWIGETAARMGLANAEPVWARAEEWEYAHEQRAEYGDSQREQQNRGVDSDIFQTRQR